MQHLLRRHPLPQPQLLNPTFSLAAVCFVSHCLLPNQKHQGRYDLPHRLRYRRLRFSHTFPTAFPYTLAGDDSLNYFKKVIDGHKIESTTGALSSISISKGYFWLAFFTFLYVDILDTTRTLYSMARFSIFINDNRNFEGQYFTLMSNATSIITGLLSYLLGL
ncbi:hypothetical protein J5N97_024721 [Dioscorea zingiberensis]|uniref:Uncharacterized protein n=1 Tax=Dioscorea zingiberensis TaxID=325984 RepID=A0A9D5H902_9LILI|nr:hypothetical protein J5N97_024721 [Dioscorea zingiberensis]